MALGGLVPWTVIVPDYLDVNPFLPVEGTRSADGLYYVLPAWTASSGSCSPGRDWDLFIELLGAPDEPEGLNGRISPRGMNTLMIREVAARQLADRTCRSVRRCRTPGNAARDGADPLEYVAHPQTVARAPFVDGIVVGLELLGHTVASPRRAGRSPPPVVPLPSGAAPSLPLAGIRVVEFGVAAVVPECVWMLSELGAEVIKIESTGKMDNLRFTGLGDPNKGFAFNTELGGGPASRSTSRSRRDAVLPVSCASRRRRCGEQSRRDDGQTRLDHHQLRAEKPELIYAVAATGEVAGMGDKKAYGPLNAAFAGIHPLWSHPDGPYPSGTP